MKASQVKKLIDDVIVPENTDYEFLGIKASPRQQEYRNKMEFSFGDAYKGGPLALGMHKRGSFYDIVDVPECRIVDDDFHTVLTVTLDYFKERNLPYYHKLRHTGYLRHLLVRKADTFCPGTAFFTITRPPSSVLTIPLLGNSTHSTIPSIICPFFTFYPPLSVQFLLHIAKHKKSCMQDSLA